MLRKYTLKRSMYWAKIFKTRYFLGLPQELIDLVQKYILIDKSSFTITRDICWDAKYDWKLPTLLKNDDYSVNLAIRQHRFYELTIFIGSHLMDHSKINFKIECPEIEQTWELTYRWNNYSIRLPKLIEDYGSLQFFICFWTSSGSGSCRSLSQK